MSALCTERKPMTGEPGFDKTKNVLASLKTILAAPDMASRRWVWEQYDHTVMADTVQVPGGDAAVVRVHGTQKALAITTDVSPRYCRPDPFEGGKQAVAEAWRNLTAVGATPLAVTDNLNYGNPQKPEIMWEIVAGIDGIGAACRALDFPVIGSGNCSLYNETNGEGILPTPAIGGGRPDEGRQQDGDRRLQAVRRCDHPDRRDQGPSGPVHLSARDRRQGRRRVAQGRPGHREEERRFRARPDRSGPRRYRA